jgi:hypothetical protein
VQDLTKLKVETLTPLSPEVISRQATINIGKRRLIAWDEALVVNETKTLKHYRERRCGRVYVPDGLHMN